MIDVFGKLIAHGGADFVIALAIETIGGGESAKVRHGFEVPYEDVWHVYASLSGPGLGPGWVRVWLFKKPFIFRVRSG